jgi:hypothetical protein
MWRKREQGYVEEHEIKWCEGKGRRGLGEKGTWEKGSKWFEEQGDIRNREEEGRSRNREYTKR